jgi:fatty-acyl-CoA synthase
LSPSEVGYILRHSAARLLVVDTELAHLVEPELADLPALRTVVSVEDVAGGMRLPGPEYEAFLTGGSPEPVEWPIEDEDETIAIDYTSGTTGRPKGVMYTHRGAYLNSLGELIETRMTSDSVYLWTLPMFHCNGWCLPLGGHGDSAPPTSASASPTRPRSGGWSARRALPHFCAAPTVLISLVNSPAAPTEPVPRKLIVSTAAAPPSPTIIRQVEALGAEIVHVYGLTEVYGPYTVNEWQPHWDALPAEERARLKARQGVGYLVADDARVVDEAGRDVPADGQTVGEVVMRGNNTMKGYYADPEATAAAFRGGWFHSGDLAVMHPDGYLELRDRKKDIIISGARTSPPSRSNKRSAPTRRCWRSAVVAVPDDHWGEAPKAFVALKPGGTATEEELIAFVRGRLARSRRRRRSSSASCRRRAPARSRSSPSASESGPGVRSASTNEVAGRGGRRRGERQGRGARWPAARPGGGGGRGHAATGPVVPLDVRWGGRLRRRPDVRRNYRSRTGAEAPPADREKLIEHWGTVPVSVSTERSNQQEQDPDP